MQAYMHVCNMIQRCPLTTPSEQGENMMAGWGCPDKDSLELTRGDESTPPRTAVCKSIARVRARACACVSIWEVVVDIAEA